MLEWPVGQASLPSLTSEVEQFRPSNSLHEYWAAIRLTVYCLQDSSQMISSSVKGSIQDYILETMMIGKDQQ